MKTLKKHALTLLMAMAMMVSLVACGGGDGDTSAAGTYNLTNMNAGGVSMDIAQIREQAGIEVNIVLELKEDGNFSLDMSALGTNENISGTWKGDSTSVTMTSEGQDVVATINGTTLTMEQDGQSLTFEKA